jgi:hypothetical protein
VASIASVDALDSQANRHSGFTSMQSLNTVPVAPHAVPVSQLISQRLLAQGLTDPAKITLRGPQNMTVDATTAQTFARALDLIVQDALQSGLFESTAAEVSISWHSDTRKELTTTTLQWQESYREGCKPCERFCRVVAPPEVALPSNYRAEISVVDRSNQAVLGLRVSRATV